MLAGHLFQGRANIGEFIGKHVLEQRRLAREMCIESLLANGQFGGQIVHGYPAESVTEKVRSGRFHDSLAIRITGSSSFQRSLFSLHRLWHFVDVGN